MTIDLLALTIVCYVLFWIELWLPDSMDPSAISTVQNYKNMSFTKCRHLGRFYNKGFIVNSKEEI